MGVETAEGRAVVVTFDGSRCIHSRRCVMGEPAVFRADVEGPWIVPDAAEAERVYREDLEINPENGWALQGLAQSLRAQHKQDDAERTDARFRTAWAGADVTLLTSRF